MAHRANRKHSRPLGSSAQLDLFASGRRLPGATSGDGQLAVVESSKLERQERNDQRLATAIDYVLAADRGPGRPEKQLKVGPAVSSHRLLDVREAAHRLGLSKSTLDKMRCSGRGPRFIRATDRAVRYDPADLDAFANERRRRSTSEEVLEAFRT